MVPGVDYEIGDQVRRLVDAGRQVVKPFTLRQTAPNVWRWNCGDPECGNVLLFDEDVYSGNLEARCPNCELKIAAGLVVVRDGRLGEIRAASDGNVDRILGPSRGKADIAVEIEAGFQPREDWNDHVVEYVE
jgi:hypothetical protein